MRPPPRNILFPIAGLLCGLALIAGTLLFERSQPSMAGSGIGGPFVLTDQEGRAAGDADFKGRPFLVFFGYTHCPDVCPTTLTDLTSVLKEFGTGRAPGVAFVTVDPERDTPAVLKDYLSGFDPRIVGLTGDPKAVAKVLADFRVYAKKVPTAEGGYTMDHTAIVYLMDKDGTFVASFNADLEKPAQAAEAIRKYF